MPPNIHQLLQFEKLASARSRLVNATEECDAAQWSRVCVDFAKHPPTLYFQTDSITAQAITAAFARTADPVITVDDHVEPGLRPFPCAQLFGNGTAL